MAFHTLLLKMNPSKISIVTIAEIGDAIGKSGSVSAVGITDMGLCDALVKLI